jgi:hypothetical protein
MAVGCWITLPLCARAQESASRLSPAQSGASYTKDALFQKGTTEWALMGGGALDLRKRGQGTAFWTLQGRWGHVLTRPHGPSFVRGTLEYAVEIAPAIAFHGSQALFGGSLTPVLLQYNFTRSQRIVPFVQFGSGLLFTTKRFPTGTSELNFTPQGAVGAYWFHWPHAATMVGIRYQHTSNLGITNPNPGYEALYIFSGVSWWH